MKYESFKMNNLSKVFLLITLLAPSLAFSATINVSSISAVFAEDTSILEVYLNTEGQTINSIDGSLSLSDERNDNFEIREIILANSVFSIWPRKPSLEESHKISFVGGVPGGISGDRVLLFKIIVKINESGNFTITPNKITAYLNDGLGTSVDITKNISTILIGDKKAEPQDKWKEIVANDNNAPAPFSIELIQDPNLFDGKKFIYFETTDAESGINYYEVREGTRGVVRTGNSYVLIDQNSKVDVVVTAYDKAGNFQVATFKESVPIRWLNIFVTLVIILSFYKIIQRIRNKGRNKIND